MVTPCINDIKHFNVQLMHTTLKNVELLKDFKIKEAASSILKCFNNSPFLKLCVLVGH
jgi:hypothetical protein